ncbi:hypothetical protein Tco_0228988, partial [Tanacetum coccineum]
LHESPEPVVIEIEVSSDQNDQTAQTDEILNYNMSEHSNYTNDEQIINNLPNTKDIQISKHLSLPRVGMLTRAMAKELSVASPHECLFVDFISEEEPKKVSEALKHPGWVNAMQDKL